MKFFEDIDESFLFFKALASKTRIEIIKVLIQEKEVNLNLLAKRLNITNGAITSHAVILEENGIIKIHTRVGKHGIQKICSLVDEKYLIHIGKEFNQDAYNAEIAPGQYIDYQVMPTCGVATTEHIIGVYDIPAYFSDTEHFNAQIIWFNTGYVEYEIPNYVPENAQISDIWFQAELGSEAVAFNNDYISNIHFYINGMPIGIWQSPGDFGGVKGLYNPDWWVATMNQFGTLMEFCINKNGTFFDNIKTSDFNIHNLAIESGSKIRIRLAVPENLVDSRGLTIYGRGFGNYNCGMMVKVAYARLN